MSGGHAVALGVTLGVVGSLLVVGISYFIIRMRRAKSKQGGQSAEEKHLYSVGRKSTLLDTRHPATHITPFSSEYTAFMLGIRERNRIPVDHTPGANMRVARRRQDGAWDFEEPQTPITPGSVSDVCPSPISPTASPGLTGDSKFEEAQAERELRRDTSGSNISAMGPPPPAYHPDDYPNAGCTKE